MSEYGWSIVIVVVAILFIVAVDRGFSSFKLTVGK